MNIHHFQVRKGTSMIAKTADAAVMRLEKLKRTDFILGL